MAEIPPTNPTGPTMHGKLITLCRLFSTTLWPVVDERIERFLNTNTWNEDMEKEGNMLIEFLNSLLGFEIHIQDHIINLEKCHLKINHHELDVLAEMKEKLISQMK